MNKTIEVIGSGCPTCKKLYEITKQAVAELSLDTKVEYLTGQEGIQRIVEMGVMQSPVLAVNGKPALVGFNSDIEKVKQAIQSNL
ncbi:hypothetical protein A3B35_02815 [Candidatus Kaiserbacteria bacterium RIFCSPLOWO2_01_FULL_54_24]|uniref:Thioredoxin-like fold domain-containing protein n=1 Tax=Candidatus Kaiserbacteria bacterium RIFCSPLOWO2_01_FULL_54_24 TaxID=1798515 RepID=A0A1F6EWH8_9BACT|nr:MAG: hypothetical protein A3B35_02815 [Candidatus Kaiserbacteria bacterium RIFCSPLOWO2_01_FULL_54_24]